MTFLERKAQRIQEGQKVYSAGILRYTNDCAFCPSRAITIKKGVVRDEDILIDLYTQGRVGISAREVILKALEKDEILYVWEA